ncbi:hypothetical protein C8R44DRAFT_808028 [Mycena epipterygia]|nr:hypothetical protein C8R44DRAFT_808028 [Mycena epipterygia]
MSLLAASVHAVSDKQRAIFGPVVIGNTLNWLLLGVLLVQLNLYYRRFAFDHSAIRSLVCTILFLDVAHTILLTYHAWWLRMTVDQSIFGGMVPFQVANASATMIAFACWLTQLIAVLVQTFYAWRVWSLAKSKFVCTVAVVITLLALARGLNTIFNALELLGFGIYYREAFSNGIQNGLGLHTAFPIWSVGGLLPDTLILICMGYILSQSEANPSSGSKPAAPIITIAQVGVFPIICACIDVILVTYAPPNYHFIATYILGKMYTNSLVAFLNLRRSRSRTVLPK